MVHTGHDPELAAMVKLAVWSTPPAVAGVFAAEAHQVAGLAAAAIVFVVLTIFISWAQYHVLSAVTDHTEI